MKKILLTGGNGFFCTRFAEFYRDRYEILSLGKEELNIVDENKVREVFEAFKPDYVIHAAAIAVTDLCEKKPEMAHDINVKGSVNVAKACKAVGAKLVFLGTEQIFNGNKESGPYSEETIPVPDTVYGKNKLEAEGLLKEIIHELWILRFTWMFGLPIRNTKATANIMWSTVEAILKGEKIVAPVNEYRGMTYIKDMIESFEKIFSIPYGTYHIGSENNLNRYEVVKFIIKEMGMEDKLEQLLEADEEKYKGSPRDIRITAEKLAKAGVVLENTEEGIKRCIREELEICLEEQRAHNQ